MQVAQHKKDHILELKSAVGTLVKKRTDVIRPFVRVVDCVIDYVIVFV